MADRSRDGQPGNAPLVKCRLSYHDCDLVEGQTTGLAERLVGFARWQPSPRAKRLLLGLASLVFIAVTAVAFTRLPPVKVEWLWLAMSVLLTVATFAVNAVELWLANLWLDQRIRGADALRVSILASAANLAPIPGAAMVRGRDLSSRGGAPREIVRALASIGLGWISVSFLATGVSLLISEQGVLGAAAAMLGFSGLAAMIGVGPSTVSKSDVLWQCVLVESLSVMLQAGRYFTVFLTLGFEVNWMQALSLPLAGALASAMGVFPGGLGLRELLAGGVSSLVAMPPATGVIASAVDRIIGLSVLGCAAIAATLVTGGSRPTDEERKY